jgi:hypothetical protein
MGSGRVAELCSVLIGLSEEVSLSAVVGGAVMTQKGQEMEKKLACIGRGAWCMAAHIGLHPGLQRPSTNSITNQRDWEMLAPRTVLLLPHPH